MSKVIKLIKNTFYLLIANIFRPILSFFLFIYISRTLGVEGMGEYATIITFVFFFEILATLGLSDIIIRGISVNPSLTNTYLTVSFIIGIASTTVATLTLLIVVELINYPEHTSFTIHILALSMIFFVLNEYLQCIFQGLQRMDLKSLMSIMEVIGRVAFGIISIRLGYGVVGLITAILIVRFIVLAASLYTITRLGVVPAKKVNWKQGVRLIKGATTFLMISIVAETYWSIDVIMLSKLKGMADVGIYNAAHRIMDILMAGSYSYVIALFPIISSSFSISKEKFKQECVQSIRYIFMLTFPTAIGISILSEEVITLLYGKQFEESVSVLRVLIWTVCFFPTVVIIGRTFVASHNQKIDLICNILAMLFNVFMNFILIPKYGYNGAAISTLLSICVTLLIQNAFLSRYLFTIDMSKNFTKPMLSGCVMGIFTYLMKDINLFINIFTSASIYLLTLIVLKTFSIEEKKMLLKLWRAMPINSSGNG